MPELPEKLAEMVRAYPGTFSEAARRDARKGVAFKSKSLDDIEHGVFAQRLAQRLWRSQQRREDRRNRPPPRPMAISYGSRVQHKAMSSVT